jgi:hypothetical protein
MHHSSPTRTTDATAPDRDGACPTTFPAAPFAVRLERTLPETSRRELRAHLTHS